MSQHVASVQSSAIAVETIQSSGHDEVAERCEEIISSEVHKCPIKDLRLVLEDCTEVPLENHQQNCVRKFRAHLEEGIEGESRTLPVTRPWLKYVFARKLTHVLKENVLRE